jgi:hypothetical protein
MEWGNSVTPMVEIKGDCVGWTGILGILEENVRFLGDFCTRWRNVDKDANLILWITVNL